MSRHAVIKIRLRAVIGDHEFKDVIQFSSTFAMNSIPVASLMVAVGKNVDTEELATIHRVIDQLEPQSKAEVFFSSDITSVEQAIPGVPDNFDEIKIFEGKFVGTGWRRTETGAHFVLNLLHWLGDLNYTSAISGSLIPGGPADLVHQAVFEAQRIGAGNIELTTGNPSWVPTIADDSVTASSLSDIWGNVLHPWMQKVASDTTFDQALLGGQPGDGDQNTLDALSKIGPNADGVTLNLQTNAADGPMVASGIRQALINETGGNWVNTTLWGKLVGEWAPAYWFSVIPRVEDALIVPFTGGLQAAPWSVIGDEDYVQADLNMQMLQMLRSVQIFHPVNYLTGVNLNKGRLALDRSGAAGFYQPDQITNGLVLMKDAPRWLSDPVIPSLYGANAEGINGQAINTAMDEGGTGQDQNPDIDLVETQRGYKKILSQYAKQWYVMEVLKSRIGELSGKLRFDISPGSNILVEAGGARNVADADAIQENVYATVMQVSYMINAETRQAGTAFSLAHIRTEEENDTEGMAIAAPPLYAEAWRGAKLVTDAPGPEEADA